MAREDHVFLTWPSQSVARDMRGIGPSRAPPARATTAEYGAEEGWGAQGAGLP
jgi:hypothetical protein